MNHFNEERRLLIDAQGLADQAQHALLTRDTRACLQHLDRLQQRVNAVRANITTPPAAPTLPLQRVLA